jgi:plasmid stabilization system protein ParE
MIFEVLLTEDAARDLEELHAYIAGHDAPAKAVHVLDRIEEAVEGLNRVTYRISGQRVHVYLTVVRRTLQPLKRVA